jgi:hypothetical protein
MSEQAPKRSNLEPHPYREHPLYPDYPVDDTAIRQALRPIRGCATDDQYVDVFERVTALLATPRATGETTVEAALAELREMFPSGPSEIQIRTDSVYTIWFWPSERAAIRLYKVGETLDEAMAQVRATRTEGEGK